MIVSLEAIFLSTFVMISQNRADAKREVLSNQQWSTVKEEDVQNVELLRISNEILELTKAVHEATALARNGAKNSHRNEGTRSLTTNAVGICRQAWRGADGCCAVGGVGRVVVADRAAVAEGRAAIPLSGSEALARSAGAARDPVRALHGDRVAASAG
jgi:hypothetical protein